MSLRFVFGNSGSGKSFYLHHYIVGESVCHPEKNYLVLVPEQFTMQTQKDLCEAHPRGGIMNVDVLSFGRLAHRIFEELGQDNLQVLDDEGKNLVLRKIAGNCGEELTVLKSNLKKQGYISEVKSVISEFTQYGVDFDRLDEFMGTLNQDSYLYYKLKDIRKVYKGFEDYLSEKYITKEEMLDVLSDMVPLSEILKGSVIALDGFTGFTPVQNRLIGELLKVCEKVIITVEMDQREDPFVFRHPYQMFALSKQMAASLVKIARETGTETEDPVYLYEKPVRRFRDNPEMAFLESELFRYSGKTFTRPQSSISLHEAGNPANEAVYVAEAIRKLVREKGMRYRDIAVIASDMDVYADVLEDACSMFEIPVFTDHKKSILLNAFVEYLRSLLAMAEQNFTYESVFRHLRTGLCGFSDDEVDRLENYCLALGIRGYRKWQQAWVRRTDGADEEELAGLNHLRVIFVEKTSGLMHILRQRKKTVKDVTLAVYDYLVQENLQEQLKQMELRFQEAGELALTKEYAQIYRIVADLFDKFAELLGDEQISLQEYCDLLDAGLEEAKVGVIPPGLDQLVIGDMQRTRIKNIRALFFVGANDTLLPGNAGSGGLLSERDRERFGAEKIALSPGIKEQIYIQKFYLYLNLTKPSEYLSISWARVSGEGKSIRPAYLVQDIRRLFPGISVYDEEKKEMNGHEITKRTGIQWVARGIRERKSKVTEEWKELYTWYVRHAGEKENSGAQPGAEDLERIIKAGFLHNGRNRLEPGVAGKLYPAPEKISVTRLEQFAACACAHFLRYGLKLSDREEYGFEALDLGNIAHRSLERFSRKADTEGLSWMEIPEDRRERLINESVEESVADYGNTVLYSSARNEYMIYRVKRLISRSVWALARQMEKGDFIPSGYEMKFGSGKIDRIDTCQDEDKVYVKVTDYKTGMKTFDITAFYHGLQIQLPVYLNAALAIEEKKHPDSEICPAGIFYYRIQDPYVKREKTTAEIEKNILKELRLDGLINGEEKAVEHLEHGLSGTSVLYPMGRNKDGGLSKASRVLAPEDFRNMLVYTRIMEAELKERMYDGDAEAAPYELEGASGCDYCGCRDICGFDPGIEGCRYRQLEKYSMEETVQKIRIKIQEQKEKEQGGNGRGDDVDSGTAESN